MLRDFWNKLMGRETAATVEHEAEREQMSPEERRFDSESVDDIQADASAREHLGGFEPTELVGDDDDAPKT
jgi:hypothetical protein